MVHWNIFQWTLKLLWFIERVPNAIHHNVSAKIDCETDDDADVDMYFNDSDMYIHDLECKIESCRYVCILIHECVYVYRYVYVTIYEYK